MFVATMTARIARLVSTAIPPERSGVATAPYRDRHGPSALRVR
jgi:hypothetical protein